MVTRRSAAIRLPRSPAGPGRLTSPSSASRAARFPRTCTTWSSPGIRSKCAGRSVAISFGSQRWAARCCSSPVARGSCHSWPCCGAGQLPARTSRLLYSARTREDIIYAGELDWLRQQGDRGLEVYYTLTRAQPPDWKGYSRRIDRAMLQEVATPLTAVPHVYVCGPTLLVESVANQLVALGVEPAAIKTERFGPTGTLPNGG